MFSGRINEITQKVEHEFGALNSVQLNWKPSTTHWSIAQCLHHLIVSNSQYLPVLKKIASGSFKMNFWERYNPMSKYTGRKMVETLGPAVIKKFKAPLIFVPSKGSISQDIISEFVTAQNELYLLLNELENIKYADFIVTSPVAPLITLPLPKLIEVIVVHEKRHYNQAKRIKDTRGFSM